MIILYYTSLLMSVTLVIYLFKYYEYDKLYYIHINKHTLKLKK